MDALEEAVARHDLTDAVVRVIVQLRADQESAVRDGDIRKLLDDAYFIASINRDVERETRVRLGGLAPEKMTDRELLEKYLETTNTDPDRAKALLEHADEIFLGEKD